MAIKRSTFFIIILLLSSILVGFFLTYPTYGESVVLKNDLEVKKTELENRQNYVDTIKSLTSQLSGYSSELSIIDSAIPENSYNSTYFLVKFIEESASSSGLAYDDIGVQFDESKPKNSNTASVPLNEESVGFGESSPESGGGSAIPSISSNLKQTEINLVTYGSYEALKNFISTINSSSRMINIESISFSSGTSNGEDGNSNNLGGFSFNLTLKAFNY